MSKLLLRKNNEITFKLHYDRRKRSALDKLGSVEIEVYVDKYHRQFISTGVKCYPHEWADGVVQYNPNSDAYNEKIIGKLREIQKKYAQAKHVLGRRTTPAALFELITQKDRDKMKKKDGSFIEWVLLLLKERNDIGEATKTRHRTAIDAVLRFGHIRKFTDLTPQRIMQFDDFLRHEGVHREQQTIRNYHKVLMIYCKRAKFDAIIEDNPYDHVKIERGKSKERRPLTEDEVLKIREWRASSPMLDKARDLFIFSCYTGLAYADVQAFSWADHVTQVDAKYYIDGSRVKTGERFFTPILAPAIEILEKWDYKLPRLTNVKMNYALHEVEAILGIQKPLTSHVARHTFATLMLSKNVPIAVVQRLLGHADIATTQIYAKILDKTVADAVCNIDDILK